MHENEENITISLIIPVYNVSKYIERCLKSVIKQTYNHFECILVDDASPDDSMAICERMIGAYEGPIQFRILHHEYNRGLSAARNTGTDAAKGDYILYIDSDDVVSNDCVEKLMAPIIKDKSIEMVLGKNLSFSDKGIMSYQKSYLSETGDLASNEAIRDYYFDTNRRFPTVPWNKLTSRAFINRYHLRFIEGRIWEDTPWTFVMVKHLCHMYVIPDITYYYYRRSDSISSPVNAKKLGKHWCLVLSDVSADFTPGDEAREAAKYVLVFCNNYIRQPKAPEFQVTARRFAKALPFRKYPVENILIFAVQILPHNKTGKAIYKFICKRLMSLRK